MATITVSDIIDGLRLELQEDTTHNVQRMVKFIFSAINELNTKGLFHLKRKVLEVNNTNTVDIPSDFHSYTRLAVSNGDKLLALSQNSRINLSLPLNECGDEIKNNPCCHGDVHSLYGWHGKHGYQDAGSSGGSAVGQMRLDYERMQFVLSGVGATHLHLEYYSVVPETCFDMNFEIDARLAEVIKRFVTMRLLDPSLNRQRYDVTAYQVAKQNYDSEVYRTHAQFYSIGLEDIHEAFLRSYKLSVKGVDGY